MLCPNFNVQCIRYILISLCPMFNVQFLLIRVSHYICFLQIFQNFLNNSNNSSNLHNVLYSQFPIFFFTISNSILSQDVHSQFTILCPLCSLWISILCPLYICLWSILKLGTLGDFLNSSQISPHLIKLFCVTWSTSAACTVEVYSPGVHIAELYAYSMLYLNCRLL